MFQTRVAGEKDRLAKRATRCLKVARSTPEDTPRYRVLAMRSHEHAAHRARALSMKRTDLLEMCAKRTMVIECACEKNRFDVGCDQSMLCDRCSTEHSKHWNKRISEGLHAALGRARARWHLTPHYRRHGMRPGIYLVTLTGPHAGDFAEDRNAMGKALRKFLKFGTKHGWWSSYAAVWEATPGTDGDGHLHVHIACVSSWLPYSDKNDRILRAADVPHEPRRAAKHRVFGEKPQAWESVRAQKHARGLHQVWRDAMHGALVLDVRPPKPGTSPESAARYLSKYITKRAKPDMFTGGKAGELVAAFRNRRRVTTSAHFWIEPRHYCEECGVFYEMSESPCSLSEVWARTRPPAKSAIYAEYLERLAREAHEVRQLEMRW